MATEERECTEENRRRLREEGTEIARATEETEGKGNRWNRRNTQTEGVREKTGKTWRIGEQGNWEQGAGVHRGNMAKQEEWNEQEEQGKQELVAINLWNRRTVEREIEGKVAYILRQDRAQGEYINTGNMGNTENRENEKGTEGTD